jgi:hypothetical protein
MVRYFAALISTVGLIVLIRKLDIEEKVRKEEQRVSLIGFPLK